MKLKDKTVLVTGGNKGIGRYITKRLRDLYTSVLTVSRAKEADLTCDLSDIDETLELCKYLQTVDVDILINNAAISNPVPFDKLECEELLYTLNLNLVSLSLLTQAVLKSMSKKQWGRIVNISSMVGCTVGEANMAHYGMTKAGVYGLTKCLAVEYEHIPGIKINSIHPGYVNIGLNRMSLTKQPTGTRYCTINDVVQPVLELCDDIYDKTGESIMIPGEMFV